MYGGAGYDSEKKPDGGYPGCDGLKKIRQGADLRIDAPCLMLTDQ